MDRIFFIFPEGIVMLAQVGFLGLNESFVSLLNFSKLSFIHFFSEATLHRPWEDSTITHGIDFYSSTLCPNTIQSLSFS